MSLLEEKDIVRVNKDLDDTRSRLGQVETSVTILGGNLRTLENEVHNGFKDLKTAIKEMATKPMSFSAPVISGFISILAVGVGAFWMTINLLYSPLKESVLDNSKQIKELNIQFDEHRILEAERHGKLKMMDEWLKSDYEDLKEDSFEHIRQYHNK